MTATGDPSRPVLRERAPTGGAGDTTSLPYLLVHGSMDRASSFRRLAACLPEATILAYDRRGYAGSVGLAPAEDFAEQVADLLHVLGGRPVVALGHSFGGDVVLAAAAAHPEMIRAAVVWEPPMPWLPGWPTTTAGAGVVADGREPPEIAETFMRRIVGDRIWDRLGPATRQARRDEGVALVAEMRSLRRSPPPWDATEVGVPVIVGTGDRSREHHQRAAERLAGLLPDARMVVVPGADHGAHLSRPTELADLLRRAAALAAPPSVGTGRRRGAESSTIVATEEPPS